MDQFHHDIRGFAACLQVPPPGKRTPVTGFPSTKKVPVLRSGKQAVADWHEGVSIRSARGEHPESGSVFHGAVIKDSGEQFHLFGTGAVKQAVSNNEDIFTLLVSQWFHEAVDNAGREQCCEALPVRPGIVQETVDGILRELPFI